MLTDPITKKDGRTTGFASPADDHLESSLNLHEYVVQRPAATFFMRANGNGMRHKGIFHDDVLIVDRPLTPINSSTVVVVRSGELLVREWCIYNGKVLLCGLEEPAAVMDEDVHIWGVVTYVVHKT